MVETLTKFGIGANSYDLSDTSILVPVRQPNGFGDFRVNNVMLMGTDGAYNGDGRDRPKSNAGQLAVSYKLLGDGTEADMAQKLRDLYQMQNWGEKRLFKHYGDGVVVWTWATVKVSNTYRNDDKSYVWMPVDLDFSCPKARWYGKTDMQFFDDGWVLDDGINLSVAKVEEESVGDGDTVEISNAGNADAGAYIRLDIPVGVSVENFSITRRNEIGLIVDQLTYVDTLVANDVLVIDARNHETIKNMIVEPSYANLDENSGQWMVFPPGTTTVEIGGTFTGGNALLTLDCWDTYF